MDYSTYVGPRHDYDKSDYNKHLDYGTVVGPGDLRGAEENQLDYGVVSEGDYGSDLVEEGLDARGANSDLSSSTLPIFNNSIRGSLLSLNSAKKKNITQV